MPQSPIGIFDSGVGGLTVCRAIADLLPQENIIYFGDTARFPYGTRSQETIIKYSREITKYLISKGVKMVVIACNTASAAALDTLRKEFDIPIIGVIESGARAACKRLKGDTVGVIATRATVNSCSYERAIHNLDASIDVIQNQATLFVSITEEGFIDTEISRLAAKEYIEEIYSSGVRTLILGCTHFPLLKKTINDVYPDMDLVDTGIEIALEVKNILVERKLENKKNDDLGNVELFASDTTETLKRLKKVFFFKNGTEIKKVILNG